VGLRACLDVVPEKYLPGIELIFFSQLARNLVTVSTEPFQLLRDNRYFETGH
jgi:hypothetical protein